MKPAPRSATARVPGTTSNLGPGFDTLGIALQIYNSAHVARADAPGVRLTSPIAEADRSGALAMLEEAANAFFRRAARKPFGVDLALDGDVPLARGLGSSVTARLGLAAGLNRLCGDPLDRQGLFELVADLEHHPDNAAPAVFGGFTVAGLVDGRARCLRVGLSSRIRFVTLIPRFEVSTAKARTLLPASYSRADTIHNLNRAAFIAAAFATRRVDLLCGLFEDRVHQPYRQQLIPQLPRVVQAGERAGAIGGWLSGSGSTIICMTLANPERVARAMLRELPDAQVRILPADSRGLVVRGA